MSSALLIFNIKKSIKLWIIFFLILLMYQTIIIGMYDPENAFIFEQMMEMLPQQMVEAMGFVLLDATLTGFVAGYYYGFIVIMFPMMFVIIMSYSLIAKYVDNGSMAYLLSTPMTRQKFVVTQAFTLIGFITDLFIAVFFSGWIFMAIMFPGLLELKLYFLLNLGALMLFFALSGITFFCSALFNEGRRALAFCVGLPVGFFVINMLQSVDQRLEFLRYFTLFTLYDNELIFSQSTWIYLHMIILFVIGLCFFFLSIVIFKKKDLTL